MLYYKLLWCSGLCCFTSMKLWRLWFNSGAGPLPVRAVTVLSNSSVVVTFCLASRISNVQFLHCIGSSINPTWELTYADLGDFSSQRSTCQVKGLNLTSWWLEWLEATWDDLSDLGWAPSQDDIFLIGACVSVVLLMCLGHMQVWACELLHSHLHFATQALNLVWAC